MDWLHDLIHNVCPVMRTLINNKTKISVYNLFNTSIKLHKKNTVKLYY